MRVAYDSCPHVRPPSPLGLPLHGATCGAVVRLSRRAFTPASRFTLPASGCREAFTDLSRYFWPRERISFWLRLQGGWGARTCLGLHMALNGTVRTDRFGLCYGSTCGRWPARLAVSLGCVILVALRSAWIRLIS